MFFTGQFNVYKYIFFTFIMLKSINLSLHLGFWMSFATLTLPVKTFRGSKSWFECMCKLELQVGKWARFHLLYKIFCVVLVEWGCRSDGHWLACMLALFHSFAYITTWWKKGNVRMEGESQGGFRTNLLSNMLRTGESRKRTRSGSRGEALWGMATPPVSSRPLQTPGRTVCTVYDCVCDK